MLFFLISFLSFLLFLSKSLPLHPIPSWAAEMRLLSIFFCREFLHWLRTCRLVGSKARRIFSHLSNMSNKKKCVYGYENVEETEEVSVLDLPELALETILGKLSPAGLCNMAAVCRSLRDKCRDDHLWERHMREKWGRLIGPAARREWQWYLLAARDDSSWNSSCVVKTKARGWIRSLACVWPLRWLKSRIDGESCKPRSYFPNDSIMSWYQSLESGQFWFPAQVYNREHGHVGFMLSCYDAEVSYDCRTDTFHARYPPHGRRTIVIEEGVQWDRLRAPPVETSAHDLHISNCLNELHPGDYIEIQWRRNKEFPYGWWYGVVGHLESCDGSAYHCRCHDSDTIILEFNQYTLGSRWRRSAINRKDHREEGNETDGFYGGIRKLQGKDEIAMWKKLWPSDTLE